ncbi:MAG: RluA family pseudouridine synthase [Candidatus Dojkabacteria bacterium]|nr:RluA family pseudouridine synthase [Candidatus Dojkabacteria bacterium]
MKITIEEREDVGTRIDLFLMTRLKDISRKNLKYLVMGGFIKVNDEVVRPNYKAKFNDVIEYSEDEVSKALGKAKPTTMKPRKMNLDIIYEDENTLILNKPSGINVHSVKRNENNALLNGVLDYLKDTNSRARLVHRLDRDTSGVLLVSKSYEAHNFYSLQFERRTTRKRYVAVVEGNPFEKMNI